MYNSVENSIPWPCALNRSENGGLSGWRDVRLRKSLRFLAWALFTLPVSEQVDYTWLKQLELMVVQDGWS